jgi:hypothetical protein
MLDIKIPSLTVKCKSMMIEKEVFQEKEEKEEKDPEIEVIDQEVEEV